LFEFEWVYLLMMNDHGMVVTTSFSALGRSV